MKISICIPAYEMHGVGVSMLTRCLKSIEKQNFRDFEIVVSDNCVTDEILKVCEKFGRIRYIFNPKKGMAVNTNNAIKHAKGELVKILYQDDYLADENALQDIINNFKKDDDWLITPCSNNLKPFFRKSENTLGSPSVLTVRNTSKLLFDESLSWVLDLELYNRLFKKYGKPKITNNIGVIMGIHKYQHTNILTNEQKNEEYSSFAANNR